KRRLELRPPLLAFERGDEAGLLAADVRACATVDDNVEAPAEIPRVVRLADGSGEAPPRLDVLAADVDEAGRRADRPRGDEHALDERVRIAPEQVAAVEVARQELLGGHGRSSRI